MRVLHIAAIGILVASAVYAYSIKYETIFLAEQVVKLKTRLQKEKETIAVLQAEWQRLNRPERLQVLADRHLGLQPLSVQQIVRFADLPTRQPKVDEIGRKLEVLGLGQPTATPQDARPSGGRTPTTPAPR
jgi:cell division protein FtsL